ncbi:MAG: FG-GAP-like repeat-containing protein [Armatimonadota bacterium]
MRVRSLWRVALTVVAMSAVFILPARAAQFEDLGPKLNIPGCVGAAWGDYDDDGYPDLFLPASMPNYLAHPDMLLHNNHDLTFTDVSSSAGLLTQQVEDNGVASADYNNDGLLDVLIGSGTGYPKLYRNDGGHFSEVASTSGFYTTSLHPGRSVAWCDYDGDNQLDVFICNILDNVSILYHNSGDGTFTDVTQQAGMSGLSMPYSAYCAAWGDYDNDGHPDLMVSRFQKRPMLFHNNGDGTFTEAEIPLLSNIVNTAGVAWADYDNDGWLDCYLASGQEGPDSLLHNNGDGTFTEVSANAGMGADVSLGSAVAWADYDNDGWLDLYVGNLEANNQPFLYHNNGNGTFTDAAPLSGLDGSRPNLVAIWADVDRDGRLDLFQGAAVSYLFHNIGPAGNWLRVRALTSKSGDATGSDPPRDAIGAVVSLNLDNDETFPTGAARTLMRVIDGGSGFQGQNEQIAHFGLADATMLAVRVRFPDGSVVVHRDVAANQQITIRDVPADYVEIFTDVPLDYWAYPQVKAVEDANIVNGYSDGTYKPTDPVTRDQMAVYISRALAGGDSGVPTGPATATFSDVPTDYWAFKYVEYAVDHDVVKGYSDGTY